MKRLMPFLTSVQEKVERAGGVRRLGVIVAVLVFALDQASKNLLLYGFDFIAMRPGEAIAVTPFFNLVMAWNRGVSYGMFQADSFAGKAMLVAFALGVTVLLSFWLAKARHWLLALGLGLVIGGALGNVLDRVLYGAVADFFDFHVGGYHWYIFNVADIGIVVGVGLLIVDGLVRPEEPETGPKAGLKTGKTARKPADDSPPA